MEKQCLTCKTPLMNSKGAVSFKCPKCLGFQITRCAHCRKVATKYVCSSCGFEGPN